MGYSFTFLLQNGIDPEILMMLPEELRIEQISQLDLPPQPSAEAAQPPTEQNRVRMEFTDAVPEAEP